MNLEKPKWPDGKKCAAMLTINLNAELFWLQIDPSCKDMPKTLSLGQYGMTRGVERAGDISDLVLTEEEQEEAMKKGIEAIQNVCGVTPVGFRAPEGELTLDTLRIAKKYGMHYSSNLCDDDRPYQKDLENGETLLEIPIHWDNYDLPYFAFNYHPAFPKGQGRIANYTGVINNWKDEFYGCYEYGLCYVLQLDPAAIGAPGRIGLLEELLDYIDEFDSVWWTSGEEMYQYYQNK